MNPDIRGDQLDRDPAGYRPPPPQQLPPEPDHFHNQEDVLSRLATTSPHGGPTCHVLVGQPGVGKSAVALRSATLTGDRFPDGRIYLNLRGHQPDQALDPLDALATLIRSVIPDHRLVPGLDERASTWRTLSYHLRLLVLLDNAADSAQVLPLLPTGAHTVTLVTSRSTLPEVAELTGTQVAEVAPFDLAHAVELLRALIEPHRGPVPDDELAELARACGQLQLALRVAAQRIAKVPLLSVPELAELIRERSDMLDPVRAGFEGSYLSLPPDQARLFRLLGLAPGSDISLDAACAVGGGSDIGTRELAGELISRSLLRTGRPGRVIAHDLAHAYMAALATDVGREAERSAALDRLGHWYARAARTVARAFGSALPPDAETARDGGPISVGRQRPTSLPTRAARDWYAVEEPNLTIMVRELEACGRNAAALELCRELVELYAFTDAARLCALAGTGLRLAEAADDDDARAWFHEFLGKGYAQTGRLDDALAEHETALELRERVADRAGQARSRNAIGLVWLRRADHAAAEASFTACLDLARAAGDGAFETLALLNLGRLRMVQARAATAAERHHLLEQALTLLDAAIGRFDPAEPSAYLENAIQDRAETLSGLGRHADAHEAAEQAVAMATELNVLPTLAPALLTLGRVELARGSRAAATALRQALEVFTLLGDEAGADGARALLEAATQGSATR